MDHTDNSRPIKMLALTDEQIKEALAIHPARRVCAYHVADIFVAAMIRRGIPHQISSYDGT